MPRGCHVPLARKALPASPSPGYPTILLRIRCGRPETRYRWESSRLSLLSPPNPLAGAFTHPRAASPKAIEGLAALGFKVGSTRGVVRVEKYGCGAEFRKGTDGLYQMTIVPTIMLNGQFTRLWDAGYQKFLLTDEGLKFPALAAHLQNLRKFNEELRTALGVPTFYNEALGSVSQVSVYDRVKGRKGDVPDETVGAHSEKSGH